MIQPKEFRLWMASIEVFGRPIQVQEVAQLVGRAPESLSRYRRDGVRDGEEKMMRLAMAAISSELKPWGVGETKSWLTA